MSTESQKSLGPMTAIRGDRLQLYAWRGLSITNMLALLIPLIGGIACLFLPAWRILGVALLLFFIYGCVTIFRSFTVPIAFREGRVLIFKQEYPRTTVAEFEGRRLNEPSGMDDHPTSTQLWMRLKDGRELPIAQLSGYARIEEIAAYLNARLPSGDIGAEPS